MFARTVRIQLKPKSVAEFTQSVQTIRGHAKDGLHQTRCRWTLQRRGKTMDWNTVLSTIVFIGFLVMMMRGCGMAGGGCGMGHVRRRDDANPRAPGPDQSEQRAR